MSPDSLAYFKKCGDFGPFMIMLELDKLPEDTKYLQITVDFNEHKTGRGDPIIRLSQVGDPRILIPQTALEGPPASYAYEQWRKDNEAGKE